MHCASGHVVLVPMDDDDRPIGRVLSRREVLALMGGTALLAACAPEAVTPASTATATLAGTSPSGAAPTAAASTAGSVAVPSCVVRPEQSEGPFYVDSLERSDIRSDPGGAVSPGAPLALTINVLRVSGSACSPLASAIVDVWHCDAAGVYSDVSGNSQHFLRGHQLTDASGRAAFTTVYPGWYQGRAVHIHFKIRTPGEEFTSQLYFDDTLSDTVYQQAPYARRGTGRTRNSGDGLFRGGGADLMLDVKPSGSGYAATFDIGLAI